MVQPEIGRAGLGNLIIESLHKDCYVQVKDLVDRLHNIDNSLTIDEIRNAIEDLEQENLVVTRYRPTRSPYPFHTYLIRNYTTLPFWLIVVITTLTLTTIYLMPSSTPWFMVRLIVGGIFMLIMPGFSIVQLLFPTKDISNMERFVLSVGLSLALLPLIGLVFAYSQFGIQLNPMVILLSLLCNSLSTISVYREFRVSKNGC